MKQFDECKLQEDKKAPKLRKFEIMMGWICFSLVQVPEADGFAILEGEKKEDEDEAWGSNMFQPTVNHSKSINLYGIPTNIIQPTLYS